MFKPPLVSVYPSGTACDEFEHLRLIAPIPFNATIVRTGGPVPFTFAYVPLPKSVPIPKSVGRPRLHKNDADRQYEYRRRKRQEKETLELAALPVEEPKVDSLDSLSRGQFMLDAPHGRGQLVTGGYDTGQIARVSDAGERDENGRRHRPKGQGAAGQAIARDEDGADTIVEVDNREREDTFVLKQARAFERPSKPLRKKAFKSSVKRLFCPSHSVVTANTDGAFKDGGEWVLLFAVQPGRDGTWKLACGCHRESSVPNIVTPRSD